jgi:TolA-binding protein
MAKQNFLFLVFCLVLLSGVMQGYFLFERHFSPHKEDQKKIAHLQEALEQKELHVAQLENQIVDFQQEVAVQLPALKKIDGTPRTFHLRSLASVTQKPLDGFEMSGPLSEKARAEFRRGDFKSAANSFSSLTQKFPTSPLVIQAYFFWAESLFMNQQQQECLDVIDQMMTQFPEHELTGFIMLRMGQILQNRSRTEEAAEVFRVVGKKFAFNHELKVQAEKLFKSIE